MSCRWGWVCLLAAVGIVAAACWSPARPQEDRCYLIEKAVSIVGTDPSAIEQLAKTLGIKVTRARRAEAKRCLQRIARNG